MFYNISHTCRTLLDSKTNILSQWLTRTSLKIKWATLLTGKFNIILQILYVLQVCLKTLHNLIGSKVTEFVYKTPCIERKHTLLPIPVKQFYLISN